MPRKKLTQEERVARMSQKVVDTMREFGLPNVANELEERLKRKREADVPVQVDVETTLETEEVE